MSVFREVIGLGVEVGGGATAALLRGTSIIISPDGREEEFALPPEVARQLEADAWQVRLMVEQISATPGSELVLQHLTVVFQDAGRRVVELVSMADTLIEEAERTYGTAKGRGKYKREQVKAAMLYAAHKSGYDLPWVPSILEPAIFSLGADMLVDFVVAQININDLWGYAELTPKPASILPRIGGPVLLTVRRSLDGLSGFLTALSWKIVLKANPLSPGMRAAVDRFSSSDAAVVGSLNHLRQFIAENPDWIRSLASLFAICTRQANRFTHLTDAQRLAYIRQLVLTVLRQFGIYGGSPIRDRLIEAVVTVGIDATVTLFSNRGGPSPIAADSVV